MVGLVDHYGAADCSTIEPGRDAIIAIMAGGPSEKLFRRGPCSGDRPPGDAVKPPLARHWRSYGTDPLRSPAEALAEPFAAFPS